MNGPVGRSVQTLWHRIAEAETPLALMKTLCVEATALFELHQCMVAMCEPDGRPYLGVDNVRNLSDDPRLAFVDADAWRHDPMLRAVLEHRGSAGTEVVDTDAYMELARRFGYDGDRVHTLMLPLVAPAGLIGLAQCGLLEPFTEPLVRDLLVVSTHVSVRLAQLGVAPIAAARNLLTPRQDEVAQLAASGRSNPEIAAALAISENTVKKQLKTVFARLGVSNRTELSVVHRRSGLPDDGAPIGISRDGALTVTRAARRAGLRGTDTTFTTCVDNSSTRRDSASFVDGDVVPCERGQVATSTVP